MGTRRTGIVAGRAAIVAGLLAGGLGASAGHAASRPAAVALPAPVPAPDALTQPLVDGCQRDPLGLFTRTSPEWAYVYNTPSTAPAPPPRWVTGTVSSFNPAYQAVHISGGDLPFGHRAYDFNVNILTDPQYQYLLGGSASARTGNYAGSGEESFRLHTEWEDLSIPQFAWPEPGDRISELGSWVWDCGHWGTPTEIANPDYILPTPQQAKAGCLVPLGAGPIVDQSQCRLTGESTEFHPYRAIWDVRARSVTSPYGDAEGDLYISTDQTLAGVEADCAHRFPPPTPQDGYPPQYRACLQTATPWQDVSGEYSFVLSAPPRSVPGARLVVSAVDEGSQNAPAPTLTPQPDGTVRVDVRLSSAPGQPVHLGYAIHAGWDRIDPAALPTHVRVTLGPVTVHRAMDPGCTTNAFGAPLPGCPFTGESLRTTQLSTAPGDWNLTYDVSGAWGRWTNDGSPELLVDDGQVIPGTQAVDVYIPPRQGWRLLVLGRECDLGGLGTSADCPTNAEIADDNDVPGMVLDQYASIPPSLGAHVADGMTHRADPTSTCPDSNPHGCYSVAYSAAVIDDAASRSAPRAPSQAATGASAPVGEPVRVPDTAPGGASSAGSFAAVLGLLAVIALHPRRSRPGP